MNWEEIIYEDEKFILIYCLSYYSSELGSFGHFLILDYQVDSGSVFGIPLSR